jgi:transcriptional regulator with XRE-family HTH domain
MKSSSKSRKIFAAQVKKHRQAKGWRLEDLHQASGLSYNYLSTVENGRANISMDNADAIAKALGVPLAVLLIDQEQGE